MTAPSASHPGRTKMIAFAAGFGGLMPMATDVYLIVMPAIARHFEATLAATHASMAMFAIGFGVAHLFIGVLADSYGRRPVAIIGTSLFLLSTIAVTMASSLPLLSFFRFIQGLCIATCPIIGRALIRDSFTADAAAKAYAQVNATTALSPLVAPFIGAAAAAVGGWRLAMAVLAVYGIVLVLAVAVAMPETKPPRRDDAVVVTPIAAAREILTHPRFLYGGAVTFLLYAALFTWISTSPFLMIDTLGFSPTGVALVLGVGSLGYMAGSLATARFAGRYSPEHMVAIGAPLMALGAIGAYVALTRASPGPVSTLIMVFPFYVGLGLTHANGIQIVMRPFPHMAAQASAWLGVVQQLGGVIVSVLAVKAGAGLVAVQVMIAACTALIAVSLAGRYLVR